tara:strand:- start:95 stop:763 length:669 start_codon:yes stop_codon:yes gene_type:complete
MKNSIYAFLFLATLLGSCSSAADEKLEKEIKTREDAATKREADAEARAKAIEEARNKETQEKAEAFKADSLLALEIKGYKLTKISGSSRGNKIVYTSVWQEIEKAKTDAKKKMTTDKQLALEIKYTKERMRGGNVRLDVTRATRGVAEGGYFTCIIKDSDDQKELYRKKHSDSQPSYSQYSDNYNNYLSWWLDKTIKTPFYLYIVDEFSDEPLKLKVTAIKR